MEGAVLLSWVARLGGVALVVVALADIYVTTIAAAGGGGPVTRVLSQGLWRARKRLPARDRHRSMQRIGHVILVAVVLTWLVLIWGGFTLLFLSEPASVIDGTTKQPAGVVAKLGYATGGLAGAGAAYLAGSGGWVLLNNLAAVTGLTWAALTLTYLFQVVTAASHGRALALRILGIAEDPVTMAAVGSGRRGLGPLGQHLSTTAQDVALMARYHQALPVLTYFHVSERRAAIEIAICVMDEALTVLAASDPDTEAVRRPMRIAIGEFLRTSDLWEDVPVPPAPDWQRLREAGVTVDRSQVEEETRASSDRRRKLHALAKQRAWDWDTDVSRPSAAPTGAL